jgi:hypothetical protein
MGRSFLIDALYFFGAVVIILIYINWVGPEAGV